MLQVSIFPSIFLYNQFSLASESWIFDSLCVSLITLPKNKKTFEVRKRSAFEVREIRGHIRQSDKLQIYVINNEFRYISVITINIPAAFKLSILKQMFNSSFMILLSFFIRKVEEIKKLLYYT